ncbi:hypothetical protein CRG98_000627 [Punica granatum]|uniref:Uncharacterized protein n=1 Tax=Punica granatum TaxID=22663 RepID=A0A2I0LFJ2_PUNGR|nr:hypothetical protein CRG98_000627 [Punica granatum]
MKMGGGEDSGRRKRRFPLLGVAATAREDAGDGSKHRLGYAVLGMGVTGVDTAGIEGKSRVFRRVEGDSLGEDGSITKASNFPVDPNRLGKSRVFPVLVFRRFFESTKHDFYPTLSLTISSRGSPRSAALDFGLTEKRWELELELGTGLRFKLVELWA